MSRVSTALLAFVTFLLSSALVLPQQAGKARRGTGSPQSLDLSLLYSAGDRYSTARSYSQAGRRAWVRARLTIDPIRALVDTLFPATAFGWVFARALARRELDHIC
jgi:hypothetical protein